VASNKSLNVAQQAKKDEFYTQLADIENELKYYRNHFRGKVVYCNCDDPTISNFFHYFYHNFAKLGLKQLITTCYKNQNRKMFSQHDKDSAIGLKYDGTNMLPDDFPLDGEGDFRSQECIDLLQQSDIVVTNPPFSLFREYVAQLMEYKKKFLIIGNLNAVDYSDIFPLIKEDKVWLGASTKGNGLEFRVPQNYSRTVSKVDENGNKYAKLGFARWFTNLDYKQRYEDLILFKRYSPEEYPRYDNYDAIEVSKTIEIPCDYDGVMGVPISFIDKHNPKQFEILGITDRQNSSGLRTKKYTAVDTPKYNEFNRRSVIKRGDSYTLKYVRILIRRRRSP